MNEKTWSVCFKDILMLKPFLFFEGRFWIPTHLMMCTCLETQVPSEVL